MNRFPDLEAVREHLRNPTPAMLGRQYGREARIALFKELAENHTLVQSKGRRLVCYRYERVWFVAMPGVMLHLRGTLYNATSRAKALRLAALLEEGLDLPWDGDDFLGAVNAYRENHGVSFFDATLRVVAGDPVLDPHGDKAADVAARVEA